MSGEPCEEIDHTFLSSTCTTPSVSVRAGALNFCESVTSVDTLGIIDGKQEHSHEAPSPCTVLCFLSYSLEISFLSIHLKLMCS